MKDLFSPPPDSFDETIYETIHDCLDRLIQTGSACNAHADVLDPVEDDPQEPAHRLFRAQVGIEGGEDEAELLNTMISLGGQLLIVRNARRIIIDS
jgi:hypothetical protein